jgi:hypothetical protein
VFSLSLVLSVALALILESAWPLLGLAVTLITALVVAIQIFLLKYDYVVVYKSSILYKRGFIIKKEKKEVYTGVRLVTVEQSFMGRILGYGEIKANLYGAGIITVKDVKNPSAAAQYLESLIVSPEGKIKHIVIN